MKRRTFLKALGLTALSLCVNPIKTLDRGLKKEYRSHARRLAISMARTKERIAADVFNNSFGR